MMQRLLLHKLPPQHYVQVQRTLLLYQRTYEAATGGGSLQLWTRTVCLLFA